MVCYIKFCYIMFYYIRFYYIIFYEICYIYVNKNVSYMDTVNVQQIHTTLKPAERLLLKGYL